MAATFASALLVMTTATGRGESISFQGRGHMIEARSPDFQIGDTLVIDYTFDPTVPVSGVVTTGVDAIYQAITSWRVTVDRGYKFVSSAPTFVGEIALADNNYANPSLAEDRYIATFFLPASVGLGLPSGDELTLVQIDLGDSSPFGNPELITNLTLPRMPPSIDLSTFAGGRLVYAGSGVPDQPYFVLDSIAVVPEPPTILLGLVGILCYMSFRCSQPRELQLSGQTPSRDKQNDFRKSF